MSFILDSNLILPGTEPSSASKGPSFKVTYKGNTLARTGVLSVNNMQVPTPVVWLGQSLKSRVWLNFESTESVSRTPILINFSELRLNLSALNKAREHGLHKSISHSGPILLDSGGYQFQKMGAIDLCPKQLSDFYKKCGANIAVSLDHPLSPSESRSTNQKRWYQSLENLALLQSMSASYVLMPVVHGYTLGQLQRCCEQIRSICGQPCIVGIGSLVPLLKASHIGGQFRYRQRTGLVGDHVDFIGDAIATVRSVFPNSMLHVFGAGGAPTVLALLSAGVDSCDSAAWRIKASYGAIQLPGSSDRFLRAPRFSKRVRKIIDSRDIAEIKKCTCSVCRPISTVSSRRLLLRKSFLARATHNAHVLTSEINLFRIAVHARCEHDWLLDRVRRSHRLHRLIKLQPQLRGADSMI